MTNLTISISMILLTVVSFAVSTKLYKKYSVPFLNPMLTCSLVIIIILLLFKIPYETYMLGGAWINELLGATVVALAYPLYKHIHLILENLKVLITSIMTAIIVNFVTTILLLRVLDYPKDITISAITKNLTSAVALQVSDHSGGIPSLAVVFVMISGFTGLILGPYIFKYLKFDNELSRGLALGNASHAIGTTRALEYSLKTGSISSAGMILTAIISAFLVPFFIPLFF